MIALGLGLALNSPAAGGDTTPGGVENALLLEDGTFGLLLEDDTYLLLEA